MRFTVRRNLPLDICSPDCPLLISASGSITADTPADFDAFARGQDLRGGIVVLDSDGGSVRGAIALGRAIRALGLATTVGRVTDAGPDHAQAKLLPDGQCDSMCPFVLLGGVRRFVPAKTTILVHDIWPGDRREDAAAAEYSADDLVLVQQDVGLLAQYTLDMSGNIELLQIALRIPPWEPLRPLSLGELQSTGLDTREHGAHASPASASAIHPATWASQSGRAAAGFHCKSIVPGC